MRRVNYGRLVENVENITGTENWIHGKKELAVLRDLKEIHCIET